MPIDIILFYLFSSFSLISALLVISSSNAVHSVLFLILVFFNIAGLLLLIGAEFLAFMFLIVYVGAIAVLFLFVVMMLNVKIISKKDNIFSILPVGFSIFVVLFTHISSVTDINFGFPSAYSIIYEPGWTSWIVESSIKLNIETIGCELYTRFSFIFLVSGVLLLLAMLGAIVLTMHQCFLVKRQNIVRQLSRNSYGVVKFVSLRK